MDWQLVPAVVVEHFQLAARLVAIDGRGPQPADATDKTSQ
jgi:hypothetical protein